MIRVRGRSTVIASDSVRLIQIQNSLFSTQHIVHATMFFAYDLLKRERAEDTGRGGRGGREGE